MQHPDHYDGCPACVHAYTHDYTVSTGGICSYKHCTQ